MNTYIAFLRGINVGGHHKLPMADLKVIFNNLGYTDIITILNSGNIIFKTPKQKSNDLEKTIEKVLEETFHFPVPTCIREASQIQELYHCDPFQHIEISKDIRLYISLLKEDKDIPIELPWVSTDTSYQILEKREATIISVLDLSISKTTTAMKILENNYGKNITTRNWKTIERIIKKL